MPSKAKKCAARSHDEARGCLCAVCFEKTSPKAVKIISSDIESQIQTFGNPQFSLENIGLPNSICDSCRMKLDRLSKSPEMENTLPKSDYSQLIPPPPDTRNQSRLPCPCTVCVLARTKFPYQSKALLSKFVSKKFENTSVAPEVRKQCMSCYSFIGKGLSHICTKSMKRENQVKIVKSNSEKTKAKVASTIVKHIFEERGVDMRGGTVNLETGGKPLKVTVGSQPKARRFDVASMMKLQTVCNLSDKTVLKIAAAQRVVFGRKSVEPYLKRNLTDRNHKLDSLFSEKTQLMSMKKDKETKVEVHKEKTGVFFNDLDQLVSLALQERGEDPRDITGLVGLDQGQGSLKVALTLVNNKKEDKENVRSKYSQGVAPKNFKDTSVKKLLLLSVYPDIPEVHSNLNKILEDLGIEAVEFLVCADIKMLLLLIGKPEGKPTHGCPFCDIATPYSSSQYTLYTVADLYTWHQKYLMDGSKYQKQKLYQNFVNSPLVTGPPDRLVLDLLNLPSLHILIGVVDKHIKEIEKKMFTTIEEGEQFMEEFLKDNSIIRKKKQGKSSLEGNQSREFLKKVDQLEEAFITADVEVKGQPYIASLRSFNQVVEQCFEVELKDGYMESIRMFETKYRELNISITPKVHMVFSHIEDFLRVKNESAGLGFWCEQAFESCHHDFKTEWDKVKVDSNHPAFGVRLKTAVSSYNAKHL